MAILENIVIPIVQGFFVTIFFVILMVVFYYSAKNLGIFNLFKRLILMTQKNKLLQDDALLRYCVARVEKNWDVMEVKKELLLANKYSKGRINQILYVYEIIYKEMKGDEKTKGQGYGKTKKEQAGDLPN